MDLLTTTDLKSLTTDGEHGPAVSLFMPTSRAPADARVDPLQWKNLLTAAATSLHDEGLDEDAVDALLEPAWKLHADLWAWRYMSDGLAMFLRPGWQRLFRVPVEVPHMAVIGDRFAVSPLLGAISSEDHFLLLAVSQRNVRLLEGTRHRVEEVELPDVPVSLRDTIEAHDPRSDTMTRSLGGGRSGPAVFYGQGAGDDEFKNEEMTRFLRRVAEGIHSYLAAQHRPMVLVGLERNVGLYRDVNSYGNLLEHTVSQNPDELSVEELHDAAWPVAAEHFSEARRSAIERFGDLHGTGMASANPTTIHTAADQGRVETLLVAREPSCWDRAAGGRPEAIRLGAEQDLAACELYDRSVLATLLNGGKVYRVDEPSLLGDQLMVATFRY